MNEPIPLFKQYTRVKIVKGIYTGHVGFILSTKTYDSKLNEFLSEPTYKLKLNRKSSNIFRIFKESQLDFIS